MHRVLGPEAMIDGVGIGEEHGVRSIEQHRMTWTRVLRFARGPAVSDVDHLGGPRGQAVCQGRTCMAANGCRSRPLGNTPQQSTSAVLAAVPTFPVGHAYELIDRCPYTGARMPMGEGHARRPAPIAPLHELGLAIEHSHAEREALLDLELVARAEARLVGRVPILEHDASPRRPGRRPRTPTGARRRRSLARRRCVAIRAPRRRPPGARGGHPTPHASLRARQARDGQGVVTAAESDPDYTTRPDPSETLTILRALRRQH
jgi:hypothetical protein